MKKTVRLLGSALLLAVLAWRLDWPQVGAAFARVAPLPWLLALALYAALQAVSGYRWRLLARVQGYDGPLRTFVAYYFVGMFFNLALPTSVGGDVVRVWYLANRRGTGPAEGRRRAALVSVLAERCNGVLVLVALACVALACNPADLPPGIKGGVLGVGALTVLGLAGLPAARRLFGRFPRLARLRQLTEDSLAYVRHPRPLAAATLLSVVVQAGNVVVVWLVGEALGLRVPPLYYGVLVPLVTLLTLLPVSVNGMGLREFGTVVLLAPQHVAEADAVTLAFLSFCVYTAASLAGGVCYLWGQFPRFVGEAPPAETGGEDYRTEARARTSPALPTREQEVIPVTALSVVIPIKDEVDNLRPLYQRLCAALDPLCAGRPAPALREYEIVFVDDGSLDGSFAVLEELAARDRRVKVVRLRRNFGQTPALQAGIDWSRGDVVVTMDGDLQNDPADIPMLLDKLREGHDAVFGLRANRQDGFMLRKLPSNLGNWLIRKVTGVRVKDMGCTLRALRRDLAEALPLYGELHRFVPVLVQQQGARVTQVAVRHHPRTAGRTKYGITRTVRVVLDLITVKFLHTYVTRPMHVFGLAGLVSMGLGCVSLLATVWMKYGVRPPTFMTGNPLLLLTVMLELVGVQFISIGLIGEMLTRTYFESQGKAAYLVRGTLNLEGHEGRRAA